MTRLHLQGALLGFSAGPTCRRRVLSSYTLSQQAVWWLSYHCFGLGGGQAEGLSGVRGRLNVLRHVMEVISPNMFCWSEDHFASAGGGGLVYRQNAGLRGFAKVALSGRRDLLPIEPGCLHDSC